jgi:DNA-binding IclR family transcriptional regulator
MILRQLLSGGKMNEGVLIEKLQKDPSRVRTILTEMEREGFLRIVDGTISIR